MMIDPQTALGTGLAILGSKELLNKILGPTADYCGEGLRNLVAKRKAQSELGPRTRGIPCQAKGSG